MSIYLLLIIPQWVIFVSIIAILYGWVEKKKVFGQMGCIGLALLGLFALLSILLGIATPDLYVNETEFPFDEFEPDELPKEMHIIPIYWGLVINGIVSLVTIILDWLKKKGLKIMVPISVLVSLALFFMLLEALRA